MTAAAAAIAQAIKASGAIVRVEPAVFQSLIWKAQAPLVVTAPAGWRGQRFAYLAGHRGLVFYTKSDERLDLGSNAEVVEAKQIWVPQ